jgi:hypothetical protein
MIAPTPRRLVCFFDAKMPNEEFVALVTRVHEKNVIDVVVFDYAGTAVATRRNVPPFEEFGGQSQWWQWPPAPVDLAPPLDMRGRLRLPGKRDLPDNLA